MAAGGAVFQTPVVLLLILLRAAVDAAFCLSKPTPPGAGGADGREGVQGRGEKIK